MRPASGTLKLPARLLDELEGQIPSGNRIGRSAVVARKEKRKAERAEKKQLRKGSGQPPRKRQRVTTNERVNAELHDVTPDNISSLARKASKPHKDGDLNLKLVRKATSHPGLASSLDNSPKDPSTETTLDKIPRAIRKKLAEDDAEIAFLEKKLGIKSKKTLAKSFKDDGLDDILNGIDEIFEDQDAEPRADENSEWLARKRQKARTLITDGDNERLPRHKKRSDNSDSANLEGSCSAESEEEAESTADSTCGDSFSGFESDITAEVPQYDRLREHPFVPPKPTGSRSGEKYIPPSLRAPNAADSEDLIRLRRQIQGLVNRLTESNLLSILVDIERLYRDNARQNISSILVDVVLSSVCEPTALPDTLIILPAGFIAAIYKVIGIDFGAQIIKKIVELFDKHYLKASEVDGGESSKEALNLLAFTSELYNFQVIGSNLMFDYIRILLTQMSELNAELLLKMIRVSGPQLRQDDPSALKDIVTMLHPGEQDLSVRTKFMIETINDLKNNRLKAGAAASAVTSEHTIKMKKLLGTLNSRSLKASEPLRIGLQDIKNSDKRGKWWLIGASWTGNQADDEENICGDKRAPISKNADLVKVANNFGDSEASDLAQLAREHRMNTDIRRAIFVTIMSSSDYQDACLRLMKLRLKKVQELEIPKVLIHCLCAEEIYNPYYMLIAKQLCGGRQMKKAFQFSLWDMFRRMGETADDEDVIDEDDEEDGLDSRQIVHLGKMFGSLVADGVFDLAVLKHLNFINLQPKTTTFVEILVITVFLQSQRPKQLELMRNEEAMLIDTFSKIKDNMLLVRGLEHFIKKVIRKTDVADGKNKAALRRISDIAIDVLRSWQIS